MLDTQTFVFVQELLKQLLLLTEKKYCTKCNMMLFIISRHTGPCARKIELNFDSDHCYLLWWMLYQTGTAQCHCPACIIITHDPQFNSKPYTQILLFKVLPEHPNTMQQIYGPVLVQYSAVVVIVKNCLIFII